MSAKTAQNKVQHVNKTPQHDVVLHMKPTQAPLTTQEACNLYLLSAHLSL